MNPAVLAGLFDQLGHRIEKSAQDRDPILAVTGEAIGVVPGVEFASVSTLHRGRFRTLGATHRLASAADALQYEVGHGPCVDAVVHDAVFASDDIAVDPRWPEFGPRAAAEHGVHSVLSIRLVIDPDDVSTGLNLYSTQPSAFGDESRLYGLLLATHGAAAVIRDRANSLERALQSRTTIGVAMGVLMTAHKVTRDQAFNLLRIASQNTNRKLVDIAEQVEFTGTLDPQSLETLRRGHPRTGKATSLSP